LEDQYPQRGRYFSSAYVLLSSRNWIQIYTDLPIVAGEWVGPKVQTGVALEQFEKKVFVIVACNISNFWVPIEKYHDLHNEAKGIYNISRGRFQDLTMDVMKPEVAKEEIMRLTLLVENECPFSKTFSKTGTGEGIVWVPEQPLGADPKFWFKSKGEKHRISNTENLPMDKKARTADAKTKAKSFAEHAVTENRLKQGLDYLREMGIDKKDAEEQFLAWLYKDVTVEEKILLQERGIDYNFLKVSVREIGHAWYKERLGEFLFMGV
jgi:hypothetical protein